jgi:hypothetical protein
MFTLSKLFGPQIAYGSSGGGSGGGGGGGGGSSRSSSRPKPRSTSRGRNRDADAFAGSRYKAAPTTKSNKRSSNSGKGSSSSSVTAKDLKNNNVSTYRNDKGGSLTVARGVKLADAPTVNVGVNGGKTVSNTQAYNSKDVAGPTKQAPVQSGGSSAPVTAPEKISPEDGVGGGRDGGGSAKRKASNVNEDNIVVKRQAQGVDKYKNTQTASIKQAGERRRKNSMKITKSA